MTEESAAGALAKADLVSLGKRLRATRLTLGLTQQDLAADDISAAYVSRIEAGQRRPDFVVAQRLASRLGVSVDFLATGVEPADEADAILTLRYAELALRSGEAADAASQLEALRVADVLSSDRKWEVAYLLGLAHETLGRLDAASLLLEEALTASRGTDALRVAMALCRCYRDAGDLARSIQVGESARQQADADNLLGVDDEIRLTLSLVGTYFDRGDVVYAAQLCQQAIERAEANHSASARAAGYWNASVIAAERGHSREALEMADRALALLSEGEDQRSLARLKLQYGTIMLAQDEPGFDAARELLESAKAELASVGGSAVDVARCDVELGRISFLTGNQRDATERADAALSQISDTAPFVAAEAHVLLGRIAASEGEMTRARAAYARAVAALTGAQADREVAQLWYHLGELLEAAGDDAGARDAFRSASASLGLRQASGAGFAASRS